jgi:uncharacterized protein
VLVHSPHLLGLDPGADLPLPERLLVDEMLGRLSRWLRLLGYDAEAAAGRDDDELLAAAEAEQRLLLTRDTRLVTRRPVNRGRVDALLVRHDHLDDQLGQLHREAGLARIGPPRCLVCNHQLLPVSTEAARGRVPEFVAATHTSFRLCPSCDRVVWPGSHWQHMLDRLGELGLEEPECA